MQNDCAIFKLHCLKKLGTFILQNLSMVALCSWSVTINKEPWVKQFKASFQGYLGFVRTTDSLKIDKEIRSCHSKRLHCWKTDQRIWKWL